MTVHLPDGEQDCDLRRAHALPGRGHAPRRPRRQGVRLRLVAGLGGQGHGAARRTRGASPRASSGSTGRTSSAWACAPLQFLPGESVESLGLSGHELFSITGLAGATADELIGRSVTVRADGAQFQALLRIDTETEAEYYLHGGILRYVVRKLAAS